MKNKLLVFTMILLLPACGFQPQYGTAFNPPAQGVGSEDLLSYISIGNIPDREGQVLRNALIDRFYRNGIPDITTYDLEVLPIDENLIELDITRDSDSTRGQLRLSTTMTLIDKKTGETVLERDLRAITSYNILSGEFATRVSEENARQNALADLAAQIERQLILHFQRL